VVVLVSGFGVVVVFAVGVIVAFALREVREDGGGDPGCGSHFEDDWSLSLLID